MNREKIMGSRMFALLVGEKVRDELTDEQIAMFLYYTHNRKEPDFAEGGRVLHEAIAHLADKIIDNLHEIEKATLRKEDALQDVADYYRDKRKEDALLGLLSGQGGGFYDKDRAMKEKNAKEKSKDDAEALYIVLRTAELGCEQKHIKHVAGMCGYSWPPTEKEFGTLKP